MTSTTVSRTRHNRAGGLLPNAYQFLSRVFGYFPPQGRFQFFGFALSEFDLHKSTEARMRPVMIGVLAPGFDNRPRFGQAQEDMLVQAFRRASGC